MNAVSEGEAPAALTWYDVSEWGVEGRGWDDVERFYDRLPKRAQDMVRGPVWNLSHHSAGMCTEFITDAPAIHARWVLWSEQLAMWHMPATGVSGLDLYAWEEESAQWFWLGVGGPDTAPTVESQLISGLAGRRCRYRLYLPLYNGVESVEIGLPAGSSFEPVLPRKEKPMVFYGTSIVQGGCASRPGMHHVAILGRRFGCPVINLGFSGNGMMEPELAQLLAELEPSVYVIDCLPNMSAELVAERAGRFVQILREAHAATPIVLVEDRSSANARFIESHRRGHAARRQALRRVVDRLEDDGVQGLHYVTGDQLLGLDGEGTVDGSHPSDLGFVRMAEALAPVLKSAVACSQTS